MQLSRFQQLVNRWGYKITPVSCTFGTLVARRPDIMAVEKHGEFIMTIPSKMYPLKYGGNTDLLGHIHPSYFDCEDKLYKKRYGK